MPETKNLMAFLGIGRWDAMLFPRPDGTEAGLAYKYTFSGSIYFERMKQKDFTPRT